MLWRTVAIAFVLLCLSCSQQSKEDIATQAATGDPNLAEWQVVANGIQMREMRVASPFTEAPFDMVIARIDPSQVSFRVHYTPPSPRGITWYFISEWDEQLADPLLVVNASFFSSGGRASGFVVTDGQAHGVSFDGFGGMFQVIKDEVRVRSLVEEPFQRENFNQAAQGFPMLVEPGGRPANTGDGFDILARRTMIAQDANGHILILITNNGTMTLRNAINWLLQSGLYIDVAFGLDGGKSTGMVINGDDRQRIYPNFDRVAVVLAVYAP